MDDWWGSSTGQVAKMFLGESFAVGDAYAEGSARLFKGFSGFNGPGLGLDQKWPSPSTPAGGFQITIPETGNGPVVFQTYNGLTGGYQFDGVLTVDSPLGAEIDFSVDGVVSAAIVNDSAGLYALAPSYFEVMNAATEVQWARIDATGINIPAGATYKVNGVPIGSGGGGAVDDTAYGPSWDGVTTIAPSKNAVYDKIQSLILSGGAGIPNGDAGDVVVTGSGAGLTVESAHPASGTFDVAGSIHVTGSNHYFGPQSGPVADNAIVLDCTNYYNWIYFRDWLTPGTPHTDAYIGSMAGSGFYVSGTPNIYLRGGTTGNDTLAQFSASGALFSVGGVDTFDIHSQGFRCINSTSSSITAGTAAAPSDVQIYFDTTNYYNILTFRKLDGTAYSTHAGITGSATNGLTLGGYPGFIFYAGS